MESTTVMPAAPASTLDRESIAERRHHLAVARRRATALLGAVTVLFIAVTAAGAHGTLLGYVQAGAEASMVGGVADWFAVTALFRRPLGLPIPHTALIVERKDQFAATLGQFVQENFLNADVLAERIRAARLVPRLAAWLADQANAARFAGYAADLVVTVAEALRDEDVQRVLTAELTRAIDAVEVAPLAGRALRVVIADGQHAELFNTLVFAADRYLDGHRENCASCSRARLPAGYPTRSTGGSSTGCTAACASGWWPWPPTPTTPPGASSRRGSPDCPTASRPHRTCASAASGSSTRCWAAPGCGTGPPRCGRRPRKRCGPRPPTRNQSCAAGWPSCWWRPAAARFRPGPAGRAGADGRVGRPGRGRPVP